MTSSNISS